jgi:hypothetical protein
MNRKQELFFITILSLVLTFIFFLNVSSELSNHEVEYNGDGIPLSEIPIQITYTASSSTGVVGKMVPSWKKLEIQSNEVVYIDQSVNVDEIVINGQLHCENSVTAPVEIKARTIYVNGTFQCGTWNNPFLQSLTLSLKSKNVNPATNPSYRGLIVNSGGKLILNGNNKKSGYVKLNQTIEPGQNTIVLSQSVQSFNRQWSVGDRIVIAPTSYSFNEDEEFSIMAINGNQITLDRAATYRHWGQTEVFVNPPAKNVILDQRAEVVNLNRNIKIQSDESTIPISDLDEPGAELGAHVMVMNNGEAYVNSVEFYRMGQAGVMARYPFHWHVVGNAEGQFIINSSIHHSFQRCITVHRTDFVLVDNNTCYNFKGHGFFLEDGTEKKNEITNNIGIKAKYPYYSKRLLASDINPDSPNTAGWAPTGSSPDRAPTTSVFWISHPDNKVQSNIAAGSVGSGFWMAFEAEVQDNDGTILYPSKTNTFVFSHNQAHSNLLGFTWSFSPEGESANNPNNPADKKMARVIYEPPQEASFKNLVVYKNSITGLYTIAKNGKFENIISADNGIHYFITYNQKIKNASIFGRSQNHNLYDQNLLSSKMGTSYLPTYDGHRREQKGIIIYDGPLKINNVKFINYPTAPVVHIYNNQEQSVTPIPFGMNFGFENFANTAENVSFHPDPFYRVKIDKGSREHALFLRDKDGSLTGVAGGAVVLGKSSISPLPNTNCIDGGEQFKNTKICPATLRESRLHIAGGTGRISINGTIGSSSSTTQPFVVRRSDGVLSESLAYWPNIFGYSPSQPDFQGLGSSGRTKIGIPHTTDLDLELMLKTIEPDLWMISEIPNPLIPVIKMVAQGKNCYLSSGEYSSQPLAVDSLQDLRAATSTAYYTNEDDFYFRLIPNYVAWFHNGEPESEQITHTSGSYKVHCAGPVDPVIKGEIDSVTYQGNNPNGTSVTVKGWACHFSKNNKINVDLKVASTATSHMTLLGTQLSNLMPDPNIAFKCGIQGSSPAAQGYRFQFLIPSNVVAQHAGKKIFVSADSAITGINDQILVGSGTHNLPVPLELER